MSRWTHVAAIFRIDSIGEISDNEIIEQFGRTVDWEEMADLIMTILTNGFNKSFFQWVAKAVLK